MLELNKIYCGDSLEIMKEIPDKSIDLVLTDPPYGIGYNGKNQYSGLRHAEYDDILNDTFGDIDYKLLIEEFQRISFRVIIFGALNFLPDLPFKGTWICWDKRTKEEADKLLSSPFEMAWCDKVTGYHKIYRVMHGGVINADGANQPRYHPTQKPVKLMQKILRDYSKENETILDPFLGSGTTALACLMEGRNFIGIEREQKYCDIAEKRIDLYQRQGKLDL